MVLAGTAVTAGAVFSAEELRALRKSGAILSKSLRLVAASVKPGVATQELDAIAEQAIRAEDGEPAFLGYRGFPASLCVSLNDEVVHGIPRKDRIVKSGDLVGLDLGVSWKGMYTDMATTVFVGDAPPREVARLLLATRRALAAGLSAVRPRATTGDIGAAVQRIVEGEGFGVVRDLVGHAVGRSIHEEPSIPNFGAAGSGTTIEAGMALAIEPMVTEGSFEVETDGDGWTVRTRDGRLAAHEERTVLVTNRGYELLTKWDYGTDTRH